MTSPLNARQDTDKNAVQEAQEEKKTGTLADRQASRIPEVTAKKIEALKGKSSGLKHLRITAAPKDPENPEALNLQITATRSGSPHAPSSAAEGGEGDEESVLMLTPAHIAAPVKRKLWQMLAAGAGAAFSIFWLTYGIGYVFLTYGFGGLAAMAPPQLGGLLAGILAPVALLWIVLGHALRSADIQRYSEALRAELQSIIFPSEERASRVSKDIERLCQQAAELSAASKAVIKAIGRARQGLRGEMRDFLGASQKAEAHIDRLAGALGEKSQKLLALTDEIEQRTSGIGSRSQAGVDAWEEASKAILSRAAEIETAMARGSDKIIEAAGQAGDKAKVIEKHLASSFESLNQSVDGVAGRLENLSGNFDKHVEGLKEAASHMEAETGRLAQTIESQIAGLEDVADRTLERMEESAENVRAHREALDSGAEAVARQAETIADTINASLGNLNDAVGNMETKTELLEERIAAQAGNLREAVETIGRDARQIEEAGVSAASKLSESMASALSGAESVSGAVRRSVELLEKAALSARDQAEGLARSAQEHIEQIGKTGEANAEHIREIVGLLEKSKEQIAEAVGLSDEQVEKLSAAVEDQGERINVSTARMVERMRSVQTALEEPLKAIGSAAKEADYRHVQIEEMLTRRVADLHEASQKAQEGAEHIRAILRDQAQEISALAGQITGHARSLNEQMAEQKTALQGDVVDVLQNLGRVGDALETQAGRLGAIAEDAAGVVTGLEGKIQKRCEEMSGAAQAAIGDLERLDEAMAEKSGSLRDKSAMAVSSISDAMQSLEAAAGVFDPVFTRVLDRADESERKFAALQSGFETSADSNLERLKEIGILFDGRLESLQEGAGRAAGLLKTSSEELQERALDIERASLSASGKMEEIRDAMRDRSEDIHLITDQALLKIETVQRALDNQFHELSESVGQALVRVEDVDRALGKAARHVDEAAGTAVSRLDSVSGKAREEGENLNIAAAKTVTLTGELVARVKEEADGLLNAARETLMEMKKAGDSFEMKTREIGEQMGASLKVSRDYGSEMKQQASFVAQASVEAADRISSSLGRLAGKLDEMNGVSRSVLSDIDSSSGKLLQESQRLLQVSAAATKAADEVSASFGKQANALFKAVEDAAQHTDKIRKEEWRMQRNAFMGSAKFIVESLHSLSVDITRLQEGDVPEKTWKAFQKGDIAAFTRRLAEMGSALPVEKIRDKFAKDSEFRSYVQRFLRQYEELFDQAVANDYGDLLGATFMSSDVGKLYLLLCSAAGREPKTVREDKWAA